MNIKELFTPELVAFVAQHRNDDVRKLAFLADKYPTIDFPFALNQVAGMQTASTKLPTWADKEGIVYPPHISMEQCSSEPTARYKAELAQRLSNDYLQNKKRTSVKDNQSCAKDELLLAKDNGTCVENNGKITETSFPTLIDITGGFGVDFSFMAQGFNATYVEQQPHLCEIALHNFPRLGLNNAKVVNGDGVDYLHTLQFSTIIYLDPARRNAEGGKTVAIADCTPNLLAIKEELIQKSGYTIVKLSPMLDWHKAVRELNAEANIVREVHAIAVKNECKELLFVLSKGDAPLRFYCANDGKIFSFNEQDEAQLQLSDPLLKGSNKLSPLSNKLSEDSNELSPLSDLLLQTKAEPLQISDAPLIPQYLYEPNSAIMKLGGFAPLSARYGVKAVSQNSHLFVSVDPIDDFAGRSFRIRTITSMNKKELRKALSRITAANITVRNFPLSVADLRKKLKLKDGGNIYLFATTDVANNHLLIVCEKC